MIQILGSFAEFERTRIGERHANAKAFRRRSGRVYSTFIPFGYRVSDGKLVRDPERFEALRLIRGLYGKATLQAICDELSKRRVKPPRGEAWRPSSIVAIMNSKWAKEKAA